MALYKTEYIEIDPDTCSKEELREAILKMQGMSGYFETKQLAIKTFINSVYGATASKYFVGHNTAVAESITLQGQDLNHYSENCVNKYFRGIFQSKEHQEKTIYVPLFEYSKKWGLSEDLEFVAKDKEGNWLNVKLPVSFDDIRENNFDDAMKAMLKKVSVKTQFGKYLGITLEQAASIDLNKGRVTEQKPLDHKDFADKFTYLGKKTYLEGDPGVSGCIAGDTDSFSGCSEVHIDNEKMTVELAFTKFKYENFDTILQLPNGQEIIPVKNHTTLTFDPVAPLLPVARPINYVMRHKVTKPKFRIKSESGKEVIVTGDHSCMVIRDNKLIPVKAKDINIQTDRLVEIV